MYMRLLHMHGTLGGGVALPGMFFCVAAQIVTFVATERCQPPTIARKMICGSPRSALRRCCPTRKRVLLFRTWSMSLWRRPDFPLETVLWPRPVLACVCVHTPKRVGRPRLAWVKENCKWTATNTLNIPWDSDDEVTSAVTLTEHAMARKF